MSSTPETIAPPPAERASGLATYFKVLYAPGEAFATLARVPMWGWAAVIGVLLTLIGTIILLPATMHYAALAQEQRFSQMPADQAAAAREFMGKYPWINSIGGLIGAFIAPWLIWLVGACVFLIGAALGGGEARFKMAWVTAVNTYLIPALGSIVSGTIVMLRGAANANTMSDLYALPSLSMLVHGGPKLTMFLYTFNIVNIWFYIVLVIALEQMLKMSRTAALVTVVILALISAGLGAAFAR
ncbi:MAG TPA: YIP1 family protein [Candidatus Eremiobacteraceae bacterium]|nr:YIP1 family protein [Candidatus Eremiobacteraceae bacterium]